MSGDEFVHRIDFFDFFRATGSAVIPLKNGEKIVIRNPLSYSRFGGGFSDVGAADGSEASRFFYWADMGNNNNDESSWRRVPVYRIEQEFDDSNNLEVTVTRWYPFVCSGGGGSPYFSFSFGTSRDIFWSRSKDMFPEKLWKRWGNKATMPRQTTAYEYSKEQSLHHAFGTIFRNGRFDRVEITKLKDEIAYEVLYQKLLHHPTITKVDFPTVRFCKRVLVNCCCNLIINSDTLEEVLFQDVGSLDQTMVQKLFESLAISRNVKVLDFRTSRHLETWGKAGDGAGGGGGFGVAKPVLHAEPILAAFKSLVDSSSSRFLPLHTLDFGGNTIDSSLIGPLMTTLFSSSLGLKRVSFRACDLTEEGLHAVAKELEKNHCLEVLDLSHNRITKTVMEQLVESLVKNKTLRELKIEHCGIDLECVECLASFLPQMFGLKHLRMDGNEFTWEPLLTIITPSAEEDQSTSVVLDTPNSVDASQEAANQENLNDESPGEARSSLTNGNDNNSNDDNSGEPPEHSEEESGNDSDSSSSIDLSSVSSYEPELSAQQQQQEIKEAVGAIAILNALEQNKSLLSLEMGEFGKIADWGMNCCQSPPYHTTLSDGNMERLRLYLKRNEELLEAMKQSRAQQAVVTIAAILHGKLTS